MAKQGKPAQPPAAAVPADAKAGKPSALLNTRVVYCGSSRAAEISSSRVPVSRIVS